ncbi:unnamed protein product [Pseudo-nitzschia multistriata]|uniref:Uncharacterized protein n=1 Tax=Pseudo-nitzschia multistriata TaxID=183589 RepID=A0A448Z2K8_9STRA|nr:unnamed protein product [Pseudo-nitzschia multistriata]
MRRQKFALVAAVERFVATIAEALLVLAAAAIAATIAETLLVFAAAVIATIIVEALPVPPSIPIEFEMVAMDRCIDYR